MAVGLCTLVWEPKTSLLHAPKLGTWGWTRVVRANLSRLRTQSRDPFLQFFMGHFGGMGEHMTFRKFLRTAAVCEALGVSKATLHRMVRDGHFPSPVKLTAQVRVWPAEMVASWVDAKVQESMKTPT